MVLEYYLATIYIVEPLGKIDTHPKKTQVIDGSEIECLLGILG